jgi:hypothetical protein
MNFTMDENALEVITAIQAVITASTLCQKVGKELKGIP